MKSQSLLMQLKVGLYIALLCFFYGAVATGQLLGLMGAYRPILVIGLSLVLGGGAAWLYLRGGGWKFIRDVSQDDAQRKGIAGRRWLVWGEAGMYLAGLIFLFLLLYPLATWPLSPLMETLHWDAGAYHFPKAIELFRTGSAWDLSIPYGEYPFGYESLLAFGLCFTGSETLFGPFHALIVLFLFLQIWLLGRRFTRLPGGLIWLAAALLLYSGRLAAAGNPWWIVTALVYTVGKNDLFLGTVTLAALYHAPVGVRGKPAVCYETGMAIASMLALSIKPNGVLVIAGLWVWVLWSQWHRGGLSWKGFAGWTALILPGVLWPVRNLLAMQAVFSEGVMELSKLSIVNNLGNPFFYNYLPKNLIYIVTMLVVVTLLAIFRKRFSRGQAGVFWLMFVSFVVTPVTAFVNTTQVPTAIAWRFGFALLVFSFLLLLVLFEPLGVYGWRAVEKRAPMLGTAIGGAALAIALILASNDRAILSLNPYNQIVLTDQYRDPVGINGYHSAYDYVRQNIHNSVIQVENGLPFFLYGPGYTNSPTRLQYPLGRADRVKQLTPEYYVIFQTGWFGGERGYPSFLGDSKWQDKWILIYEDTEGRVYQRR